MTSRRSIFASRKRHQATLSAAAFAPMIDLFTILVVAVLRGAAPETPLNLPSQQLQLPISQSESAPSQGIVIDIAGDGIYVDGRRATGIKYWEKSDELLIPAVYQRLQQRPGETSDCSDEEVSWSLISKVLLTAQQAGSTKIEPWPSATRGFDTVTNLRALVALAQHTIANKGVALLA